MLWVVSGNDPERLEKELAGKINRRRSPFESEKILVASPLKSSRLQSLLARELGIFSGIKILPPGNFLWSVLSECFPDSPGNNPLSKMAMSFSLMELFSCSENSGEKIALPGGVSLPEDISVRWELAATLGEIFDRILIYRPDWVLGWERNLGYKDPWADLWRFLVKKTPFHRVSLLERFSRLVREEPESLTGKSFLKTPVHVIGHSLLPPSFLDFLKDLSVLTDVVIYQWQATSVYLLPGFSTLMPEDSQGSAVNPLTRALGSQFLRMRDLCLARSGQTEEVFSTPKGESLLSRIQNEIINDRSALRVQDSRIDQSLRICLARTPIGEVQALYQEILDAFARDSSLMPSDVLVMVSDLDLFAPFIDAVFQEKKGAGGSIPYRILGRGGQDIFRYLENCSRVARGKCSASEVMALLDHPYLRDQFGLDHQDVEIIERWVSRLPVWWGISSETREAFGSPEPDLNTFFWGVERLLLSFPFINRDPVGNMIPFESGDLWEVAPVLERLQGFLKLLLDLGHRLPDEESGFFWGETVFWMVGHLFSEDFWANDPELYAALISFSRMLAPVNDEEEARRMSSVRIPFQGFLQMLENQVTMAKGESHGRSGHGVTFSPMVSARGISCRYIALLGMSSDLLTLKDRAVSYDPLMNDPRSGDHSRREDDQGMFLEAILASREFLFISYSGTGQEPSGEILPSVPLGHMIDWLRTMNPDWDNPVTARTLVEGFSTQSSSAKNFNFPSIPVPDDMNQDIPAVFPLQIELDDLRAFLRDPSRFFWSFWSDGVLKNTVSGLASSDPFVLGFMETRTLGKKIFSYLDEKKGEIPPMDFLTPLGLLPHGSGSRTVFESLSGSVFRLWREKNLFLLQNQGSEVPVQEISLSRIPEMIGQAFHFSGTLDGQLFLKGNQVNHVVSLPYFHSRKDTLSLWIDHLLLSVCFEDRTVVSTLYSLSGSGSESYCVKGDAKKVLRDIFSLFSYATLFPVPLFLKSGWDYVDCWQKFRKKGAKSKSKKGTSGSSFDSSCPWGDINVADRRKALEKAEKTWVGERKNRDVSPEETLLYLNNPPWSGQGKSLSESLLVSEKIALRVIAPILSAISEEKNRDQE